MKKFTKYASHQVTPSPEQMIKSLGMVLNQVKLEEVFQGIKNESSQGTKVELR